MVLEIMSYPLHIWHLVGCYVGRAEQEEYVENGIVAVVHHHLFHHFGFGLAGFFQLSCQRFGTRIDSLQFVFCSYKVSTQAVYLAVESIYLRCIVQLGAGETGPEAVAVCRPAY